MNKKSKIAIIITTTAILIAWSLVLLATDTKEQNVNYWWSTGLAIIAIFYGILGMATAKHWSWLKSSLGKAVFFISLGIIAWGVAQAGWMYFVFSCPDQEVVQSKLLDVIWFAAIPIWTYGIYQLSKATGAKYVLKSAVAKLLTFMVIVIMAVFSYYFLIIVARGGVGSFEERGLWISFFDLAFPIGAAINFILALVIFGLSWKLLGGRFKNPIKAILISFGVMYLADFAFSYLDGQGMYYNGDISDLLYLVAIGTMSLALCLLDPKKKINNLDQINSESNLKQANNNVKSDNAPFNDSSEVELLSDTDPSILNQPQEPTINREIK